MLTIKRHAMNHATLHSSESGIVADVHDDKHLNTLAAAPDLLACLAEVTEDLEAAYDDGQGARPTAISAAIHRARAAIAKAGGR